MHARLPAWLLSPRPPTSCSEVRRCSALCHVPSRDPAVDSRLPLTCGPVCSALRGAEGSQRMRQLAWWGPMLSGVRRCVNRPRMRCHPDAPISPASVHRVLSSLTGTAEERRIKASKCIGTGLHTSLVGPAADKVQQLVETTRRARRAVRAPASDPRRPPGPSPPSPLLPSLPLTRRPGLCHQLRLRRTSNALATPSKNIVFAIKFGGTTVTVIM